VQVGGDASGKVSRAGEFGDDVIALQILPERKELCRLLRVGIAPLGPAVGMDVGIAFEVNEAGQVQFARTPVFIFRDS
jgi:hypothetical protein